MAISPRNQAFLDQAQTHGLTLTDLCTTYGVHFTRKLFRYVMRQTKKGKDFFLIFPKRKKFDRDAYVVMLSHAGFQIREFIEDFVDEETGEVVSIARTMFIPL